MEHLGVVFTLAGLVGARPHPRQKARLAFSLQRHPDISPPQDAHSWEHRPRGCPLCSASRPSCKMPSVTPIAISDAGVSDRIIYKCPTMRRGTRYRRGWRPDVVGNQGTRLC